MCGITGIISSRPVAAATLKAMTDRLRHRGPDDEGMWVDESGRVGFGHRRLAIVDLSPAGHQPMHSADGRYVIGFNGEIYNHAALRDELKARLLSPEGGWRGHSDTETLLQAIACWGLEAALGKAIGMFAFALWDRKERQLHLVRDRFGEKPLYYGWVGGDFLFASELAAIQLHPKFDNSVDRNALCAFAARNYVPAPLSIFEQIHKLPPACILTLPTETAEFSEVALKIEPYWSYRQVVLDGLDDPFDDETAALEALETALAEAVMGQSLADVPVGAFLSGGIDSSTIVALYQKYSAHPVRTYTIGFEDLAYDEAPAARAVAAHLGTQHHEIYVTAGDAQAVIPRHASIFSEPFADSSQIPTCLISAFARSEVTVALSGDGGDELFGGYNRYLGLAGAWRRLERMGPSMRSVAGGALGAVPPGLWHGLATAGGRSPQSHFGEKIRKSFRIMGRAKGTDDLMTSFLDEWWEEGSPVLGEGSDISHTGSGLDDRLPPPLRMMYRDAVSYLPDDILCKVDRASMAVSLESRVPYLDHRVAAVAARIPISMKLRGGRGKHILRELLYREAPRQLFERPKAGFAIPIGQWIKGPLRDWAEELLAPQRLREEGWFDAGKVERRWQDHLSGRRESTAALWSVLMFQAWLNEQKRSLALAA
jgi:asparagine synthase (glutamine-hydrolysing)